MKIHVPVLVLSAIACGCLVAALIVDDDTWPFVGFGISAGLAAILFPRQFAGDPENDTGQYSWVLPDSQPARTIVMFIIGVLLLGLALFAAFR